MYSNSKTVIPYDDIDIEIRRLVRLLNSIDGVETVESCCGHEEMRCMIWLKVESIEALTSFISKYFGREELWHLEIDTGDIHNDWKDIHLLLHSGEYKTFPTLNLMIDNLAYRIETETNRVDKIANALAEKVNADSIAKIV